MVYSKCNIGISRYYDERLADEALLPLGDRLRSQLQQDIKTVLNVENNENLMQSDPWGQESIRLRNIYVEPLNMNHSTHITLKPKLVKQNIKIETKETTTSE